MRTAGTPRLAAALLVGLLAPALARPAAASRVVAVGDVHGSYDSLVTILRSSGVIGPDTHWSGGDTTFVQTGDLLDRGTRVREVLDLMMALEAEAPAAGGRVVALLGNHEVNNLVGHFETDPRDLAAYAAVAATFVDEDSERRRKQAADAWRRWQRRYPGCATGSRADWLSAHPPGWVEYVAALAPDGRYGAWLRRRDVVARVGDTIFLHGGLAPDVPEPWDVGSLDAINAQVRREIERFDSVRDDLVERGVVLPFSTLGDLYCAVDSELAALASDPTPGAAARREEILAARQSLPSTERWLAFASQGPLWFRGYAHWSDEEGSSEIARVAATYGATRFVVGHTPQTEGIRSRFAGRVFLIDTAMVFGAAAGGRPAALEIDADGARPIYETAPAAARAEAHVWRGPDNEPLPFADPTALTRFLHTAAVIDRQSIPVGVTRPQRVLLERDGVRAHAAFRTVAVTGTRKRLSDGRLAMFFRDHFVNEVAAYELSLLLGMDNVPPAVERRIGQEHGSLQMWVEGATMERDRRARGEQPPNRTLFNRHFYQMRVFDNLINNIDRNQGNILLAADGKVWLIDHTRAFARDRQLPAPQDVRSCSRGFWERLQVLDEETLLARLERYLPKPEILAILARRDRLVELLRQRIADSGERHVIFDWNAPDSSVQVTSVEHDLPPG